MLTEELRIEYDISVIATKDEWYQKIHPQQYVPALRDRDDATQEDLYVFESTACLQYLAAKYDSDGLWKGRSLKEQAEILSWVAFQTAGLGSVLVYF